MDKNSTFIDAVLNSKHSDELKAIFDDMKATLDFWFQSGFTRSRPIYLGWRFGNTEKILVKIIDKTNSITTTLKLMMKTIKSQLSQSDYDFNKSFYGEKWWLEKQRKELIFELFDELKQLDMDILNEQHGWELPQYIIENLKHEPRHYQSEAIRYFHYTQASDTFKFRKVKTADVQYGNWFGKDWFDGWFNPLSL